MTARRYSARREEFTVSSSPKRAFYANANEKPKPSALNVAGIPDELRASPRWVPWALVLKPDQKAGGTWTKVPLSVKTGRAADCNNPRSWGTLRQCLNMIEAGTADGVGFCFADSGLVGFDLDDHRDPATGELSAFAQLVARTFATYAEVSASGTGIKLIGKGAFPNGTPKRVGALGIELFDRGYFCLTGNRVPDTPAEVADLQPAIDAHLAAIITPTGCQLVPQNAAGTTPAPEAVATAAPAPAPRPVSVPSVDDIEARVRAHADGARLMDGDMSRHRDDHSAADLALAGMIAFFAGGAPDLIDAVFRRSGLMRSKWDEKHSRDGRTYGALTVAKSLAGKREFFVWSEPPKLVFGPAASSVASAPEQEAPWPVMGEAAFHGVAGEFVRLVEPNTEADPVALLVQLLAMFGSAAGRKAFVKVERTRHHMNEFVVLVGRSAKGRKGTSEAWPTDLMGEADKTWAKNCRAGKLASGEALVWALRDPIFGMEDGEAKCVDEGVEDKRLLITEGEFSAILKIAAKEQNTLSDQLRDAWDSKDLNNKSKGSPCKATAPHVSIIAHTNDSDLKLFLSENAMANGFANRFLFFAVKRSKSLPFGGRIDEDAFSEVATVVAQRLAYTRAVGEIVWSDAARALWIAEYDRLSRDRYGLAGSLTGRAEAHVLRLAMIYALLDGVSLIDREHLEAALAVWAYAEQTAYRLFGGQTGDPLADDLLRVLRRHPAGVGRWDLHQEAGKNIPAVRIGTALAALEAGTLARSEKRKTGGRDVEVWFAVAKS